MFFGYLALALVLGVGSALLAFVVSAAHRSGTAGSADG